MTFGRKFWRGASAVFSIANIGGAAFAGAQGEGMHAAVHVSLAFVSGVLVWLLAPRSSNREAIPNAVGGDERLEYLQQSVDALALEVERIGETQRFNAKLQAEKAAEKVEKPKTE